MDQVQNDAQQVQPDRRARKRLAVRQTISDAATRLFAERGFDAVTVDDIAGAADVGRMTVFNHFPRKEDMFFDRAEATTETFARAVATRPPSEAPLTAVRRLAHSLVEQEDPIAEISARSVKFAATVAASPALLSRAQTLRRELALAVARSLEAATGRRPDDPEARLAAELIVAVWYSSYATAQEVMERSGDRAVAVSAFLALFDRGMAGVDAIFRGTDLL